MAGKEMKEKLKPGERGFSIFLVIFGLFALHESVKMFHKDPRLISYGAFPLILSGLLIAFSTHIIFGDRNKKSENDKVSVNRKISNTVGYLFPNTVTALTVFMTLYCIALYVGLGFELSSTVFLLVCMCYFIRNQYIKNILYTVITMVFILFVFKFGFRILLP